MRHYVPMCLLLACSVPSAALTQPSLPVVDCRGDVTDALRTAIAVMVTQGQPVTLRAETQGTICTLSGGLLIPAGMKLVGVGQPVIKLMRSGRAFTGDAQSSDFLISSLTLDGTDAPSTSIIELSATPSGRIDTVTLVSPGQGVRLLRGTHDVTITNLSVINSRQHGISIEDSYNNVVDGAQLNGQVGFGIIVSGISHNNRLTKLSTTGSGLELVGMTWRTHHNVLTDSNASHTGDNCYSITGSHNRLANLSGDHCAGNGITFYGSDNTLDGGFFISNSQKYMVRKAWAAGVAFSQGFGGGAQRNIVRNVVVDDDQVLPTQQVGVMTYGGLYKIWAPHVTIRAGEERLVGLHLYRARTAGVTGTTAPTGDTKPVDGMPGWEQINTFEGSALPDGNRVENIDIRRFARAAREEQSPAQHNIGTR